MNTNAGIDLASMDAAWESDGFEIVRGLLPATQCDALVGELSSRFAREAGSSRWRVAGVRDLLRTEPRVAELATSPKIKALLQARMKACPFPVRAIFFDKTSTANWRVPWHQDLIIALSERIETAGYTAWSCKDGVLHVQPPREVLEGMVTLRLHLDPCDANNGALKVIPGSHRSGRLDAARIAEMASQASPVVCEASKGDALLMRPLLLHASSPAKAPSHRRVLHIEYATTGLPNGLRWLDRA